MSKIFASVTRMTRRFQNNLDILYRKLSNFVTIKQISNFWNSVCKLTKIKISLEGIKRGLSRITLMLRKPATFSRRSSLLYIKKISNVKQSLIRIFAVPCRRYRVPQTSTHFGAHSVKASSVQKTRA